MQRPGPPTGQAAMPQAPAMPPPAAGEHRNFKCLLRCFTCSAVAQIQGLGPMNQLGPIDTCLLS
jgi:hypothetical protein